MVKASFTGSSVQTLCCGIFTPYFPDFDVAAIRISKQNTILKLDTVKAIKNYKPLKSFSPSATSASISDISDKFSTCAYFITSSSLNNVHVSL